MFKIGDEVRILDTDKRDYYKKVLNKKGKVVQITKYKNFENDLERTKYYVEIPEFQNDFQSDGLWVFYDAMSIALTSNEVTCDDQMDAYEYAIRSMWGIDNPPFNREYTIKGENKDMAIKKGDNYMTILEIYNDRKKGKINKKYDDCEHAIKMADPRYKVWKGCVDTLLKLYEEDKILANAFAPIQFTEDTKTMLKVNDKNRWEELNKITSMLLEIEAQLMLCETYEQKMDILKTYKIIKENGKVNA